MCAPRVGVGSILAGREDDYAHVECAILSSRPIPVWQHRLNSSRPRLLQVLSGAAYIAFVHIQVIMMSAGSEREIGLTVYSTHINMQT